MKCPKCHKAGVKYLTPRKREGTSPNRHPVKRTDFHARCRSCGWEGEM